MGVPMRSGRNVGAFSAAGADLAAGLVLSVRGELAPMAWTEGNLVVPAGSELTVSGGEKWNTALDVHGSVVVNMDAASTRYYVVGGTAAAPVNSSINLGTVDGVLSPASSVAFEDGQIVVNTNVGTLLIFR